MSESVSKDHIDPLYLRLHLRRSQSDAATQSVIECPLSMALNMETDGHKFGRV